MTPPSDHSYPITYRIKPNVTNHDLNTLFAAAWPDHQPANFDPILARSLTYISAYNDTTLIGFVNVAWDGGVHAFLLDTTVHPHSQRRGIGQQLVHHARIAAQEGGIHWLHVDYEPHLETFYRRCGFEPTLAGLIQLQ
jgi:GNAT superfamily N-acetyltransferase